MKRSSGPHSIRAKLIAIAMATACLALLLLGLQRWMLSPEAGHA